MTTFDPADRRAPRAFAFYVYRDSTPGARATVK
jgi:hypothetical protein